MIPLAPARAPLRRRVLAVHRWLSLGAAFFWLLQALTGVLIVFHWEINDAAISSLHRPTDLAAIERKIGALAPKGGGVGVETVWTTAGYADRYNINLDDGRTVRVAGDGTELRRLGADESTLMGPLVDFHHDLFGGSAGSWIVAISGILLLTNLILGLLTAWPRGSRWKTALTPSTKGAPAAHVYSWHRALGLWAVVPALVIVVTGTLLKFEDGVGKLVGAEEVGLPAQPLVGEAVGFATVARAAFDAIPGSQLTSVAWPKKGDATYKVRVRAPGEIRRAYGASIVLVDANTGAVRGTYPIAEAEGPRAFMSALFPIHTGEAGGLAGRLLSIAIGTWLITMIVLGIRLWAKRRRARVARM